ncbi:MAG: glutathione S-transferase family protein [Azospirillaceae bacterium]
MKLHMHPVSMTSRPVRLFIAENGLDVDEVVVDILSGEHLKPPFAELNPSRLVPVLEDDGMVLTESSAILKYLADKFDLPSYPKDLKARARVNELMDWFNTNFYREYGYGWIYPQIFPNHKRPDDTVHAGTVAWGRERALAMLKVLNDNILGPDRAYLTGDRVTIADYFGVCLLTLGEITRNDWSRYPSIARWVSNMKQLKSWPSVNEALYGFADMVKEREFDRV